MSVQSINRALRVLNEVGTSGFTTITEISRKLSLTRPTVARISATLREAGYLYRHEETKRLCLGQAIKDLTHLYYQVAEAGNRSDQVLKEYSSRIKWPITVSRIHQEKMQIIATTCPENPYAFDKPFCGHQFPVLESASGIAFLAALDDESRERFMIKAHGAPNYRTRASAALAKVRIQEAAQLGHSIYQKEKAPEAVIATALVCSRGPIGAVGIRFIRSAVGQAELSQHMQPILHSLAKDLTNVCECMI